MNIIDFVIIIISTINLILLLLLEFNCFDKVKNDFVIKKQMTEKNQKIQQRVIKEIDNFLNYNGEEQEDTD
ncbi:MAG: hypothetical protein IJO19_04455 [Clostridia bacterium]|nr:hypothetical protein [Clostridia bacterium]